jgi:acyl-CoA reductase-like NAD-dependent aldehyde dehydrogenase
MAERRPVKHDLEFFIDGSFRKAAGGQAFDLRSPRGSVVTSVARGGAADVGDAIAAAARAGGAWGRTPGVSRGAGLYDLAAVLEGRSEEVAARLARVVAGGTRRAGIEVEASIDRLVSMAGWADKLDHIVPGGLSDLDRVDSPVMRGARGVSIVVPDDDEPLLSLVTLASPAWVAGASVVVLTGGAGVMAAVSLAEAIRSSELEDGVLQGVWGDVDQLMAAAATSSDVATVQVGPTPSRKLSRLRSTWARHETQVIARTLDAEGWYGSRCAAPVWIAVHLNDTTVSGCPGI